MLSILKAHADVAKEANLAVGKGDCLAGSEVFRGDGEPETGGHCDECGRLVGGKGDHFDGSIC